MQNLIGLLFSLLLVFICFVIAYPVSRKNPEVARKIVHIGAAQWYFIYVHFFTEPIVALVGLIIVAASIGILNIKGTLYKGLGQSNQKRNWGLVWYPISVFVMVFLSMFGIGDMTSLGIGLLGMGWGDGLAALVGMKFGKHRFNSSKSLEGLAAFFIAVTVIAFLFTHNMILSIVCGLTGAVFEFTTPFGLDNITVPLVLYVTVAFWPKSAMILGFTLMACLAYKFDLAAGTKHRYAGRIFGGVMKDDMKVFLMTNANNTNDMGFPGGGGGGRFGGGRQGLTANKMVGLNLNYEKTDKLKVDGSVRWNHSDGDTWSKSSTENFFSGTTSSFGNSISQRFSRSNQWNAQMRLEWQPDSMTNIMFRPNARYNSSDEESNSWNATFTENPFDYTADPFSNYAQLQNILKNYNIQDGISYSDSKNVGGMLQFNRRLNNSGRNITVQLNGNWSEGTSQSMSNNYIYYFTPIDTTVTNRYNVTPQDNWSYSARITYSEPIMRQVYLQFSYRYNYSYTKSDRKTYSLTDVDYSDMSEGCRTLKEK